jgi:hypothetical protein
MTPGEILVAIINGKSKKIILIDYTIGTRYIVLNTINMKMYAIRPYEKEMVIEL